MNDSTFGLPLAAPCPPAELGYARNLLPADHAVPHLGTPADCPGLEGHAGQPALCIVDLEGSCGPCQARPDSPQVHATDAASGVLDRARAAARQALRWYSFQWAG